MPTLVSRIILKTNDAGGSWQPQQSGTNLKLNKVRFIDPDYGIAVGVNGIILRTTTGGEPVTRVDNVSSNIYTFNLEQNYPNPFNPSTKIKFAVPVETEVRLNVYNTLGQQVAEIFNGRLKEGYHEVDFNAGSLTSGIYFYRLEADKFVDVKKMIVIK